MVRAYIMIKAAGGDAEPLVDAVSALDHVREAHIVAGDYDVIAEVESDEVADLMHTVATDIRSMGEVVDTKTYVCLE